MSDNDSLLKLERQSLIRKLVKTQGRVTVPELSHQFSVSDATIRRDLDELMSQGWVRRTHGGAVNIERVAREQPMLQRVGKHQAEKKRIGYAAAQLVEKNETIFLGSGTTALEVARHLTVDIPLTVLTNSLLVVSELSDHQNIELVVFGGMLRKSELSMFGHIAERAAKEFRADRVIMGMYSIDIQHGFTNDYLPEVTTDRTFLGIAPQVVIVADSSKFGRVSSVLVAPVTAANIMVTDKSAPPDVVDDLRDLGIEVILA